MHYTGTIWRPPYEASSLLLEVTAGCTHHKCKFCTLYNDLPFDFRMSPLEDVERDLQEAQLWSTDPIVVRHFPLPGHLSVPPFRTRTMPTSATSISPHAPFAQVPSSRRGASFEWRAGRFPRLLSGQNIANGGTHHDRNRQREKAQSHREGSKRNNLRHRAQHDLSHRRRRAARCALAIQEPVLLV